jgi:CubicO group peptidase (beta-lactamase class C family)
MSARACALAAFAALCAVVAPPRAVAQPAPTVPTPAEEAAIETCLAGMPPKVQVAIALVDDRGARFLGAERTAEGVRAIDNRSAVFQLGSITKVLTATLFAQRVSAGALRLDDTVASRVPFRLAVSGRNGVEMTLVQLASHTSGIAHHQPPGLTLHAFLHFHPDEPWRDYDLARFESYLTKDLKLAATPGTKYLYSNIGMRLLGLVISLHDGKPYETLLQEGIFQPLGMTSSTTEIERVRERVVPGLKVNGKPFPNQYMAALTPCGGMYTSAEDLARFARVEIDRTDPAIVLSQKPVFTISEGEYVALGWHLYDWVEGWHTLNHNGAIGGYTAALFVDTTNRCAVIVLANVMNEGDHGEAVRRLSRVLLKQVEPPGTAQRTAS